MSDLVIKGGTIIDADGERSGDVVVDADGQIAAIGPDLSADRVLDAGASGVETVLEARGQEQRWVQLQTTAVDVEADRGRIGALPVQQR